MKIIFNGYLFMTIIILTAFRINYTQDLDLMEQAELEYKTKSRQDSINTYKRIHQVPDTTIKVSYCDSTKIHNIFVDDFPTLESIQKSIDSVSLLLYSDKYFCKARFFDFNNKKRFIKYLAKNNLKDTVSIIKLCEDLYTIQDLEYQKIWYIIQVQDAASKAILQPHLKLAQEKMRDITRLIFVLSPK